MVKSLASQRIDYNMKILNRPMFRMGGPIKEGIMNNIREPRKNGGSMGAALVGNPAYPRTNGREHHAEVILGNNVANNANKFTDIFTDQEIKERRNLSEIPKDQLFTNEYFKNQFDKNNLINKYTPDVQVFPSSSYGGLDYNVDGNIYMGDNKYDRRDLILKNKENENKYFEQFLKESGADQKIKDQKAQMEKYFPEKASIYDTKEKFLKPSIGQVSNDSIEKIIENKNAPGYTAEEKTNTKEKILESLGYKGAKKNALYDAMIKAGQRVSRTGLGADNLVSDVIADTSLSYDKPEKLREAANLMSVQQDLKIDQIKAQNKYKQDQYQLKENYLKSRGIEAGDATRIVAGSPKNILEAKKLVESAKVSANSKKGVDLTLSVFFDGVGGKPRYKGALDDDTVQSLISAKGSNDIETLVGASVDIDDGVYQIDKGYIQINNGKITTIKEIVTAYDDTE